MGWINPLYEEHQRKRWLRNNWQLWVREDAHRFMKPVAAEEKSRAAQAEADEAALAAEQEAFQQGLLELRWMVKDLRLHLALRRLDRKYSPDQPRDELGKWTDTGRAGDKGPADDAQKPEMVAKPAFLRVPVAPPVSVPPGLNPGNQTAIESQLSRYNQLSRLNGPNSTAVLEFNSRAFQPGATRDDAAVHVGQLSRDQVDEACPRHIEVQSIANQAAALINPGSYPTPQAYGTAVHTWIRDEINGPPTVPPSPPVDENFRAEVSVLKSKEVDYGDLGSKRVDVYENPGSGTVCVYDIKTGESGLSFARMRELATNVGTFFPGTTKIVVTEVRPRR